MNKNKNRSSKWITLIIVVLILVFAGIIVTSYLGIGGPKSSAGSGSGRPAAGGGVQAGGGQAGSRNATVIRATPVVLGTIENSVVINGDVLTRTLVSIFPTMAGKVIEMRLQVGDRVSQGQTVAMVDPSRPGEVYSHSPVTSTISGTVLQAPVSPGDTVTTGTAVYVVGNLESLIVETFVPERFSTAVRMNLNAQVSFEAMPGERFDAVISEISPVLDPASRTLRIRLRFQGRIDPRIRAGMFATVNLVTNSHTNIPVIPRGSVINTYGSWIVFVVNKNNIAERRVISLGLESEELVEVTGGIENGELVVSAGQNFLSDGDLVRVVD
ncbi:efflux RND transporter periplasmic adaptor subunit [Treponema primitia]|uniref:efflux RND transporter periplasmic adaptor subunit n=1 Tax=Treponema primitia TaxID=88058 RepID=UPI00397EC268